MPDEGRSISRLLSQRHQVSSWFQFAAQLHESIANSTCANSAALRSGSVAESPSRGPPGLSPGGRGYPQSPPRPFATLAMTALLRSRRVVLSRHARNACASAPSSLLTPPAPSRERPLGDSSTVELRTLTPSILVRIQVPQPNKSLKVLKFINWCHRHSVSCHRGVTVRRCRRP